MVDTRVIQYVVLAAFAIYLVVYFRFDDWFKDAPQSGVTLEDISQQRANHYYQTTKTSNGEYITVLKASESSSSGNSGRKQQKADESKKDDSVEEESRLQQIFRALSDTFGSSSSESSSSSSSKSSSSDDSGEDEFLLSRGISMDKSVLNKLKQAMADEDEEKADKIIHDVIQKIGKGREELSKRAAEEQIEQASENSASSSTTEKKPQKATAPKDECDFKWPSWNTNEKYEYERVDGYQIMESFVFSGPGCVELGDQCSAASASNAENLCNTFKDCMGFTCNKERSDCQLRFAPLKHVDTHSFVSYYKPGMRDLADKRDKCEVANFKMRKGSLAAPDFNWDGVCGDTHKCVISYGLYGDNPKYVDGAIRNAELQPNIFPGWVVRIYHDNTVPSSILNELKSKGAELVEIVGIGGGIAGMFWRFLVADDNTVDRYIVRDSDSRLNTREKATVDEWIASGYSIHSIRDHPNHRRGLNGGMWGGVRGAIKNMREMISGSNRAGYGADLDFLNNKVWPSVEYDQISHDSYSCQYYKNSHPFPTERKNYEHVGQVFEHNQPRMSDINCCLINNPAPKSCRKKPEWTYG